jgi:hypothetical protein
MLMTHVGDRTIPVAGVAAVKVTVAIPVLPVVVAGVESVPQVSPAVPGTTEKATGSPTTRLGVGLVASSAVAV